MKRFLPSLSVALGLLAIAFPASAATISVPSKTNPTIQSGIDAANDGDTVVVAPGTYFEHIDFKGKDIIVTSTLSTDPATILAATQTTIIDGSSTGPTVTSSAPASQGPVGFRGLTLSYFTIQNGGLPAPGAAPTMYGGINVSGSGILTVLGSIITGNNFGGVVVDGGSAVVQSSTVDQNGCWDLIESNAGVLRALNNEISGVQTPAMGCSYTNFGTITSTNSSAVLIDGENKLDPVMTPTALIGGNTIEDNVQIAAPGAPIEGGAGVAVYSGGATIDDNILRHNSAPFARGGAIDIVGGIGISVSQNLIYGNQAGCGGGAISFNFAALQTGPSYSLLAANNTIADNTSTISTAAGCSSVQQIYAAPDGLAAPSVTFVNNIISGSTVDPAMSCHQQAVPSIYNQAVFDHNLLFNAGQPFFGSSCVDESTGPPNTLLGNIVADPQFINPAIGNYVIASTSQGVDFGNNGVLRTVQVQENYFIPAFTLAYDYSNVLMGYYPLDLLLKSRFQDATGKVDGTGKELDVIDMGAYESPGISDPLHTVTMAMPTIGYPTTSGPSTLTAYISDGNAMVNQDPNELETIVPNGTITFFVDGTAAGDPVPIAGIPDPLDQYEPIGVAYGPVNFTPGVHILTATYQPAPGVTSSQSVAAVVSITDTPAELALSASPYSARLGAPVTFMVTAQPEFAGYIPSPITLLDLKTNTTLGTVVPDQTTGVGTFTTAALPLGYTAVEAEFEGQGVYPPGTSNQVSIDVTAPTALTVQSAQNPAQAFAPFNLTAQFSPPSGAPASGYITFSAINTAPGSYGEDIGRANIADGSATRPVTLPAGTYDITATYAGDATRSASTSPAILETVLGVPTALTLTSALNPALAFQPVPLTAQLSTTAPVPSGSLSGSISFAANGKPIGTAAIDSNGNATSNAALPASTYALTASFAGNTSLAASKSAAVNEVVKLDSTATSLTVAPNPGYTPGENESLIAAVAAASSKNIPTGKAIFYDSFNNATTALPGATIAANGQVAITTTGLAPGTHTLTAAYDGDANFLPSTSAPVNLKIILSDFILAADSTITTQTEHHKNLNATLTSLGNLAGTINLTCANLPKFASCNFLSKPPLLSAGATADATIDIDTDVSLNFESSVRRDPDERIPNAIALGFLFPLTLIAARRRVNARSVGLFAAIALIALATLTGCGGHYPDHTAPGSYAFTLRGTAATGITHSTTVTLIVTK